jgi:hypothetical protein
MFRCDGRSSIADIWDCSGYELCVVLVIADATNTHVKMWAGKLSYFPKSSVTTKLAHSLPSITVVKSGIAKGGLASIWAHHLDTDFIIL